MGIKIGLYGRGKTGSLVEKISKNQGHKITSIEDADVCIDFTHPDCVIQNIDQATKMGKNIVIGTTGWYEHLDQVKRWIDERNVGLVYAPNFSLGVNLFMQAVQQASELYLKSELYDVSGYEIHHNQKVDAPSGTAIALQKIVNKTRPCPPFSSIRCGHEPGTHTVIFDSAVDTITLTHQARSREGFALGAVKAAEWIQGKKGFYKFEEIISCLN